MLRRSAILLPALVLIGCARGAPEAATEARVSVNVAVAPELPPAPVAVAVAPMPRAVAPRLPVAPMPHEPEDDLTHVDVGLDPNIESALPDIKRIEDVVVPGPPDPSAPVGLAPLDPKERIGLPPLAPPGVGMPPGIPGLPPGSFREPPPLPGFAKFEPPPVGAGAFVGRSGATKQKLLKHYGGNEESEKAVQLGLAWLARQQKQDGGWEFDGGNHKEERGAATGFALLAFLGAGETHKDEKAKYQQAVKRGLDWMAKVTPINGPNAGRISQNMYAQGIATLALAEAYGMTSDKNLQPLAQAAANYLQKAQAANGSWGYSPGNNGDTSIVGWQIQALFAAQRRGLTVDDRVIKKAIAFLNLAAGGSRKSMYGYADNAGASPGTALTAVGLLCRYYIDGWGPTHAGMIDGVEGLVKHPPPGKGGVRNLYYYYYSTQVVRLSDGEDWKNWNEGPKQADGTRKGGMRDWLVSSQNRKDGDDRGSWDPETGWFGSSCGRLGTTAVCLLNLEVYYRYLPVTAKKPEPKVEKDPDPKK